MAFAWDDFAYGALRALLAYQPMGALTTVVLMTVETNISGAMSGPSLGLSVYLLVISGIVGVIVSVLAMAVGAPIAYALGLSLRRVRWELVHMILFGLLGFALGLGTVVVITGGSSLAGAQMWAWYAAPAAIAVPFGQFLAARRALHADAKAVDAPAHA